MAKKEEYEENGIIENEEYEDMLEGPTEITMYDEDGNPVECELLGFVDYEDERFAIVCSINGEDDGLAAVLKLVESDDEESATLVTLEDEDLAERVFEKFKEEYAQDLDFED